MNSLGPVRMAHLTRYFIIQSFCKIGARMVEPANRGNWINDIAWHKRQALFLGASGPNWPHHIIYAFSLDDTHKNQKTASTAG